MSGAICALVSLSATGYASLVSKIKSWHPYAQVSYTPSWMNASGTEKRQVLSSGNPEDVFAFSSHTQANNFSFGGGLDLPISFQRRWFNNLDFDFDYMSMKEFALGGVHTMQIPAQSIIWKYTFSDDVKLSALIFDANLELYQWKRVGLFAGAGLDYSWIRTSHFKQAPQSGAMPNYISFAGSHQNQWLYHLNIGLQAKLTKHFRASIRDRYYPKITMQTGQGTTGYVPIAPLKYHFSMNQVSVSLDYLF
jgi:hypothetical protein